MPTLIKLLPLAGKNVHDVKMLLLDAAREIDRLANDEDSRKVEQRLRSLAFELRRLADHLEENK